MFKTSPPKLTTLRHSKLKPYKVLGETWLCFLPCFIGFYWFQLVLVPDLWQFFVQCTVCTLSVFFHNTSPAVPGSMHPAYLYFPVNEFVGWDFLDGGNMVIKEAWFRASSWECVLTHLVISVEDSNRRCSHPILDLRLCAFKWNLCISQSFAINTVIFPQRYPERVSWIIAFYQFW